jgi:hypothetical protein
VSAVKALNSLWMQYVILWENRLPVSKPRKIVFAEELPHVNDEIDREAVKVKWAGKMKNHSGVT